jgi:hypothetical protein
MDTDLGWTIPIARPQLAGIMRQVRAGTIPPMVEQWQHQARELGFATVCLVEYDGEVTNRTGRTISVACTADEEASWVSQHRS